ncbi:facilitated trehalose transporter Tret1-like [Photinus pyralis]|nr:facilitated trehalose transporter Tret1-like [Photinus pyralis]XP_031355731.1 facilitated trehalose transporter Tret1-like [Photinus pyralis]
MSEGLALASILIYFSEISDKEIRGMLCSSVSVTLFLGVMVINLVGSYLTIKTSSLILLVIPVINFLTFVWMPESPNYLLMKSKYEEAKQSFISFKGSEDADHSLTVIRTAIEKENLSQTQFICLFKKDNRKQLLATFGLLFAQQMSGITAFSIYAQTIFKEGGEAISPLLSAVIFHTIQLTFSVLSAALVDKLGRRPLLISSSIGSAAALFAGGLFFFIRDVVNVDTSRISVLSTIILFIYTFTFCLGLQTMPNFIPTELFPTTLKAYASTVSNVLLYSLGAISTKYLQFTKDNYGLFVPFWSFAVCVAIGLVIIVKYLPETKNKTLEEIQIELNQSPTTGEGSSQNP